MHIVDVVKDALSKLPKWVEGKPTTQTKAQQIISTPS